MKQNFSIMKWSPELALEEINLTVVLFWVQIRGVPLSLSLVTNIECLLENVGVFIELEEPAKARGYLRARVNVNTENPLINGCWLSRETNRDTWVDFSYERLQDFCFKCGRIGHANTECSFEPSKGGIAGYGDWMKAAPIWDEVENRRPTVIGMGERRLAGATRGRVIPVAQDRAIGPEEGCSRVGSLNHINLELDGPTQPSYLGKKNGSGGHERWLGISRGVCRGWKVST